MKKSLITIVVALVFIFGGMATASAWDYIHADEAYAMLENEDTYLLDIRTPCEWYYVGHPDVEGKVFNISYWLWEINPKTKEYEYDRTPKFFDEAVVRLFKAGDTIIVMCKTDGRGGRAGTELEDPTTPACQRLEELDTYTVYNLGGGFESPGKVHDGETYIGWKPSGLPYIISSVGAWKPIFDEPGRSLCKAKLSPIGSSGVSGKASLVTRPNGTTKIVLKKFTGLTPGGTYQASVRSRTCDGYLLFSLNDVIVDAEGVGKSVTVVDFPVDLVTWCIEVEGLTCGKVKLP